MEPKEKSTFIGDENIVKCATVMTDHGVFILQWRYKIAESMLDLVYMYNFIALRKLEIKPTNQWKDLITKHCETRM